MSRISDVSSQLGEFMLRGYILTDEGCPVCSIPMVRSPSGLSPQRLFCVQCQASNHATSSPAIPKTVFIQEIHHSSTGSGSSDEISRISTPPTEVSNALSSPTFAPPPDPQETMRRRAQSDMASAEIGKRMLQGWAMLAEECPNESCYGVPLVRPPKSGGEQDPRKECVVCHHVYIYERDMRGLDRLVPLQVANAIPTSTHDISSRNDVISSTTPLAPRNLLDHETNKKETIQPQTMSPPSTLSILGQSTTTLEHSLHVLTVRLSSISNQVPLDYVAVGQVAHSIGQVIETLRTVKHLHFQEKSVHA